MDKRKLCRIFLVILPIAALLLAFHSRSVVMYFAPNAGGVKFPVYYSHFSSTPIGYGNWGPLITWISTGFAEVFAVMLHVKRHDPTKTVLCYKAIRTAAIGAVAGVCISYLLGSMTLISAVIAAVMAGEMILVNYLIQEEGE